MKNVGSLKQIKHLYFCSLAEDVQSSYQNSQFLNQSIYSYLDYISQMNSTKLFRWKLLWKPWFRTTYEKAGSILKKIGFVTFRPFDLGKFGSLVHVMQIYLNMFFVNDPDAVCRLLCSSLTLKEHSTASLPSRTLPLCSLSAQWPAPFRWLLNMFSFFFTFCLMFAYEFILTLLFLFFQVFNLSQNIQEDDLQHLQVCVFNGMLHCILFYEDWYSYYCYLLLLFILLFIYIFIIYFLYSSSQNMAAWQWKIFTWNLFRYSLFVMTLFGIYFTCSASEVWVFSVLVSNSWLSMWIRNRPERSDWV